MAIRLERYILWVLFGLTTCTDAGLQPFPDPINYVDDQLSVSGQFCTSPADEVAFPVKLLIVIDESASLQCTDPGNERLNALNAAGSALNSLPNVEFGVIGFASWSTISEFSTEWSDFEGVEGGPATDYQGALSTTLRVLENDMIESGPAMRARTKYVVLFLSDGIPEPRCTSGCDDDDVNPDRLYPVCNTTEDIPDEVYVDMYSLCPDYNQPKQIMQKVKDIMSLGEFYGVGDLTLNTIFMFSDEINSICPDAANQFAYDREIAEPLMRSMAEEGLGTFRDVNMSDEIDFLDFNYESLQAPYEVNEFFAINMNTIPLETGLGIDSDRDGIDDVMEFEKKLERLNFDSDGDRFSDLFELTFEAKGFDPFDSNVPAMGCPDGLAEDRDNDGLLDCEETFLGTDSVLPDSDGDRIPDGIELRLGLDPMVHDTQIDHDFDGRLSGMEIRRGTSPKFEDGESALTKQILYSVNPGPTMEDEIRCYDFSIQGITLVPSLVVPNDVEEKGINRIMIYVEEEPANMAGSRGRFFVACVEARYLGDTYKDPPSGQINGLRPEHFHELQLFNPDTDCIKPGIDPSAPPDGGLPQ
ncbi:MAG: VWA domain-containing protein [Deltaproteobacteria bacterium]|nr:VWA domain-containing protein [Deltaproteobacteria bacterium]